jgi:hypothetical protein
MQPLGSGTIMQVMMVLEVMVMDKDDRDLV